MSQKIYHLSDSRRAAFRFLASTLTLILLVSMVFAVEHRFLDPVRPILRLAVQKIEWFFAYLF